MNIKEVFEKCNNNDYVKDNNGKEWKVDKGDLTNNIGFISDYYSLKELFDLEFKKVYDIDWRKVAVDTKILVSNDGDVWYHAHFAKFENNTIYTFTDGATSFTYGYYGYSEFEPWQYVKLYKEEK